MENGQMLQKFYAMKNKMNIFGQVTLFLITRHYIFSCSQKRRKLDIFWLQKIIKDRYEEQKILSKITSKMEIYAQRWQTWEGIFNNI